MDERPSTRRTPQETTRLGDGTLGRKRTHMPLSALGIMPMTAERVPTRL
jgi:hypothetical protein